MAKETDAIEIPLELKVKQLEADLANAEKRVNEALRRIDKAKRIELKFEGALAKKNLLELQAIHARFKATFEKKLKMNVDVKTLDAAKRRVEEVESLMNKFKTKAPEASVSGGGVLGAAGQYIVSGAILYGLKQAGDEIINLSKKGAELSNLRGAFQGTERDIENFRKATAGTVSDSNLLELSNQSTDLGISLDQQALLFSLAEDAGDKYGKGVSEGMEKILAASEGSARGLKDVGIQKVAYEQAVKELTKTYGVEISKLDAATQKQIRLEAIIKASGITMADVNNKTRDHADKIDGAGAAWDNLIATIGQLTAPATAEAMDYITTSIKGWISYLKDAGTEFKNMLKSGSADRQAGWLESLKGSTEKFRADEKARIEQEIAANRKLWDEKQKQIDQLQSDRKSSTNAQGQVTISAESPEVKKLWAEQKQLNMLSDSYRDYLKVLNEYGKVKEEVTSGGNTGSEEKDVVEKIRESYQQLNNDLVLINSALKSGNLSEYERNELLKQRIEINKKLNEPYVAQLANVKNTNGVDPLQWGGQLNNLPSKLKPVSTPGSVSVDALESWKKDNKELADISLNSIYTIEDSFASAFDSMIMQGETFGGAMKNVWKSVTASIISDISRILVKYAMLSAAKAIFSGSTGGFGGFLINALGGHSGGDFVGVGGGMAMKLAGGADFIVPPGYSGDRFGPLYVESGEHVSVTPSNQVNSFYSDNARLEASIHKMHVGLVRGFRDLAKSFSGSKGGNVYLDGRLVGEAVQGVLNDFVKGGRNLKDI